MLINKALFFLFLLSSCSSYHWRYSCQNSQSPSQKLTFSRKNSPHGVELSFFELNGETFAYLTIYNDSFSENSSTSSEIDITFLSEGKKFTSQALVLVGGQKLLLDEKMKKHLILLLLNGKKVEIVVKGHQELIEPENFSMYFKKFKD